MAPQHLLGVPLKHADHVFLVAGEAIKACVDAVVVVGVLGAVDPFD